MSVRGKNLHRAAQEVKGPPGHFLLRTYSIPCSRGKEKHTSTRLSEEIGDSSSDPLKLGGWQQETVHSPNKYSIHTRNSYDSMQKAKDDCLERSDGSVVASAEVDLEQLTGYIAELHERRQAFDDLVKLLQLDLQRVRQSWIDPKGHNFEEEFQRETLQGHAIPLLNQLDQVINRLQQRAAAIQLYLNQQ